MLKAVSAVAASKGITAYISMEEHMACGLGACLGCVVKTTDGYKRVCKEGPVFRSEDIIW
jgi:NAD(P)H-flavin reductase